MDINIKSKIHNKYLIEVRNIRTNEVKQGFAENIILDNLLTSEKFIGTHYQDYVGYKISFGRGTGTPDPLRTTLFDRIDSKVGVLVEKSFNQAPQVSYCVKKIVLLPSEYIGEIITEVGISDASTTIYTHALIKDSEGNLLVLGPKTSEEEITIYSTSYAKVILEKGDRII